LNTPTPPPPVRHCPINVLRCKPKTRGFRNQICEACFYTLIDYELRYFRTITDSTNRQFCDHYRTGNTTTQHQNTLRHTSLGENILKDSSESHVTSHMASEDKVNISCPLQHCRYMQAAANVPLHSSGFSPFITRPNSSSYGIKISKALASRLLYTLSV